jgi:nucleoside-diphosphate-sugar epimerase
MRVLVTGATGMVGAHSAAALHRAGHQVRLLVRSPEKIARCLDPLGVPRLEHVVGDVTDPNAVDAALEGCDAALHAAALLTFDRRRDAEMQRINVEGTRLVVGGALERGLDPVVHVSSLSALFPPSGSLLTAQDSVKNPKDLYARSKATSERWARERQAEGAPLVLTYPGGVWGPHDPTLNDGVRLIFGMLTSGYYTVAPGGVPVVDVRDVAAAHAAIMKPGQGPRRYMMGGRFTPFDELVDCFSRLTGRRVLKLPTPGALMRGVGRLGDALRRIGVDVGAFTYESMITATRGVPSDDSPARDELGVDFRPLEETVRDLLLWMHQAGHMEGKRLGDLLSKTSHTENGSDS